MIPQESGTTEADGLAAALRRHLEQVRQAAEDNEFVDADKAQRLHHLMHDLLTRWSEFDAAQQAILAEAVFYLVRTDDDEDDLRSPIGLDDDAEVIEAALRRLSPPGRAGTDSAPPTT